MVTLVLRRPDPSLAFEIPSHTPSRSQNSIFATLRVCKFPVWLCKLSFQRASVSPIGFLNVLIYLLPPEQPASVLRWFSPSELLFPTHSSQVGKWFHSLRLDSLVSGWDRDLCWSPPHSVASHGGTRSSRIRPSLLPPATFPLSPHPFLSLRPASLRL